MGRGYRGQRSFGAGAAGVRGAKRKAMASGPAEVSSMVDSGTKKTNPVADSWTSPPIAQQPLVGNQMLSLMDGMGDGDWYHDTYPGDIAYNSGQHW